MPGWRETGQPKLEKATPGNSELKLERLLVIGSTGLVGSKVVALAERYGFDAYGTQHSRRSPLPKTLDLDITDRVATRELVEKIRPEAIVNTAAVTNVDYCETHKEEAQRVNVDGVRNLAEAARDRQCRLIQVSTDFVFDGKSGHYSERDPPSPFQVYGQTKLEAEKIVSSLPSYAIARPSVIYGWNPTVVKRTASDSGKPMNFAMFVLDKLKKKETVKAVTDQYSSPTFADNLAEALLRLTEHSENGIFHTAGGSCVSRFEFATKVAEIFGYETRLIQPVTSGEFKQLAERPKNSCLRIDEAEKNLGMKFLTVDEGIGEMKRQSLKSS
ncbi:MAG TPA: dTDP-4-dehydrorhamnose reductase [Candidatus Bathyarchaeia archaeon]|nr:dTDP-4-dehydrorhamnose reductase [Candidatus Bathyarchaeia archaeon]